MIIDYVLFPQPSSFAMNLFDAMYFYGLWINYTIENGVDHKDGRAMMEFSDGLSFICKCSVIITKTYLYNFDPLNPTFI